ncbi:hypothetical protein DERF_005260 [Dermatophagoides farinae]|uniref:Uncharacterized protein n=1 Tax=Dermatophagoides farinae TaxID=6954 RepID=A0A922LB16_DERFA|nr:hypothetical protein DERF_005260 [Dermatophagoides farinae]
MCIKPLTTPTKFGAYSEIIVHSPPTNVMANRHIHGINMATAWNNFLVVNTDIFKRSIIQFDMYGAMKHDRP